MGPPVASCNGAAVDIHRRKTRAVLYVLGASSEGLTRPELGTLVWPDLSQDRALRALRGAFSELRAALPGCEIRTKGRRAWLEGISCDVLDLRHALRQANSADLLEEVLRRFRGPFLDTFPFDTPAFLAWRGSMRTALDAETREAARLVLSSLEHEGRHEQALDLSHHLVTLHPYDEEAHRDVIRLAARLGRKTRAFEQFEACRDLLRERFGIEPSSETRRLVREIGAHEVVEAARAVSGSPQPEPASEPLAWSNQDGLAPRDFVHRRAVELLRHAMSECVIIVHGLVGSGLHAVLHHVGRLAAPSVEVSVVFPPGPGWTESGLQTAAAAAHKTGRPTIIGTRQPPRSFSAPVHALGVPSLAEIEAWVRRRVAGDALTEIGRRRLRRLVDRRGHLPARLARLLDRAQVDLMDASTDDRIVDDPSGDEAFLEPLGDLAPALRALSVFEGRFPRSAAESVCGLAPATLDTLASMGFVRAAQGKLVLEPWARVSQVGVDAAVAAGRHVQWVAASAHEVDAVDVAAAWLRADAAPLSELAEQWIPSLAFSPGSAVANVLTERHLEHVHRVLAPGPRLRALTWLAQARRTIRVGGPGAAALLLRAHSGLVECGDFVGAARATLLHAEYAGGLGWVAWARQAVQAAASLASRLADPSLDAEVTVTAALLTLHDDTSPERSSAALAAALAATRGQALEQRDRVTLAIARHRRRGGNPDAAYGMLAELLRREQPAINPDLRLDALLELGEVALELGNREVAAPLIDEALDGGLATGRSVVAARALAVWALLRDASDPSIRREFEVALRALWGLQEHRAAAAYLNVWAKGDLRHGDAAASRSSLQRAMYRARIGLDDSVDLVASNVDRDPPRPADDAAPLSAKP